MSERKKKSNNDLLQYKNNEFVVIDQLMTV